MSEPEAQEDDTQCKRGLILEPGSLGVRASFAPFGDFLSLSAAGRSQSPRQ